VRVRSSNDKIDWSVWEDAVNGAALKLTPRGRYLEVEVSLESLSGMLSPVVYDITLSTLKGDSATDLAVSIIGDKNILNLGDNVKLTINALNRGPKSADVKVDYKIPFGLKLLSSNGSGIYDIDNGVWDVGILPVGCGASLDLILQATHSGYFVNVASIYGDMSFFSVNGLNLGGLRIFAFSTSFVRSAASMPDPDPSNNQANYGISSQDPTVPPDKNEMTIVPGVFPDVVPGPVEPPSPPNPPCPADDNPQSDPSEPQGQLARDIAGVREAVSSGEPKKPVPSFVMPSENSENRDKDSGIPLWVFVMAILGFIGAFLVYRFSSAISEYLTTLWTGILNALSVFWLYLSYLGYSFKKFLEDAILNISVQYGNYINAILQEMIFTPATGVGLTTVIGLGLRTLAVRFPMLKPLIAPAIYVLDQISYLELSEKIKEIFNKKS